MSLMNDLVVNVSLPLLGVPFRLPDGSVIYGHMNEAEIGRVNQYLDENDLKHPAEEITFPADVIDPPTSLHINIRLIQGFTGWAYIVRNVSAPYMADGRSFVHVLCATLPNK